MPFVAQTVLMGGNPRVGLEDNLYLSKGKLATNAELVEKAIRIIDDLRLIYHVTSRNKRKAKTYQTQIKLMPSKINKIAVIGTGVIGTGWIIRMLAHNKKVTAFDLNSKRKNNIN